MPANELRFEIVVDDRGTAVIQKFEQAVTDADKKIKESGKKRAKETADLWVNAFERINENINIFKSLGVDALKGIDLSKISGYVGLLKEAVSLGMELRQGFKELGEEQTAMAGSIKSGAEVDTKALKYLAEVAEEKGITMRELYKELNVEYGDQLAAIMALKKAGFDWSGVLERLGVLEKREKEAAAEAAKSYEDLAKSMKLLTVEEIEAKIEELTGLLKWMGEQTVDGVGTYSQAVMDRVKNEIGKLREMITGAKDELAELHAIAEQYGLLTEDLAQQKMGALVDEFNKLKEAGIEEGSVLWAMKDKFTELYDQCIRYGIDMPPVFVEIANKANGMLPPLDEHLRMLEEQRKQGKKTGEVVVKALEEVKEAAVKVNTEFEVLPPTFEKAESIWKNFESAFDDIVKSMIKGIGSILLKSKSFAGMMKDLFSGLQKTISVNFMVRIEEAFKTGFGEAKDKGGGFLARLKGGFGGIGKFLGGDWISGIISVVTTFMPKLVGLFYKPEWKKVGEDVGRDLGVEISENLSKKIAETAKDMGDRFAAITMHLGEIIDEVGLTAENFDTFAHRAHDALTLVAQGTMTVTQAQETLNDVFPKLVEAAEEFGITMNRELIDIIIHSREMGIEIKAVTEYVKGQLGSATDALTKMVTGFTSGSQEEFDRLSRLTLAVFNEMAANGASMIEQFDALKDVIGMLAQKQEEMGLAGSEAFNQLKRFQNLVETNRELVESVTAVGDMLTALGNVGALTEETFADLTAQAVGGFDKLVAAGFTSQEALTMMVPSLKAIQQAQETYGFTIDDNTQKLLDQAETLGLLESSDPAEVMKEGFEGVVEAIEKLTDALVGHSLLTALEQCAGAAEEFSGQLDETFDPSQVEGFSNKMDAMKRKMQLLQAETDITRRGFRGLGDELGGEFFPGRKERIISYQHGTPYVPYTGPAIVHKGETIIPASQNRQQSMQMGGAGGQVLNLQVVVPVTILDEELTPRLFRRIYDGSKKGEVKIHAIAVEKG